MNKEKYLEILADMRKKGQPVPTEEIASDMWSQLLNKCNTCEFSCKKPEGVICDDCVGFPIKGIPIMESKHQWATEEERWTRSKEIVEEMAKKLEDDENFICERCKMEKPRSVRVEYENMAKQKLVLCVDCLSNYVHSKALHMNRGGMAKILGFLQSKTYTFRQNVPLNGLTANKLDEVKVAFHSQCIQNMLSVNNNSYYGAIQQFNNNLTKEAEMKFEGIWLSPQDKITLEKLIFEESINTEKLLFDEFLLAVK